MSIQRNKATALIGPSGCGKSTFLRSLNRMHELVPVHAPRGTSGSTARTSTPRTSTLSACDGASEWSSRRRTRSRRCRSTTTSLPASSSTASREEERPRRGSSSAALQRAELWDEVKDRLGKSGTGALGRAAAAALHRARARRRAGRPAHGRARLGARPDLDARDRGPRPGAEAGVHDRDRHPQHAAGSRATRHTAFFSIQIEDGSQAACSSSTAQPRRSSRTRRTRRPRTTSRGGSADAGLASGRARPARGVAPGGGRARPQGAARLPERARAPGRGARRRGDRVRRRGRPRYIAIERASSRCSRARRRSAIDLRNVLAMLHINLHLERMADYCVTVAKLTKLVHDTRARTRCSPRRSRTWAPAPRR